MAQQVEAIVTDVFRQKMARIHAGDSGLGVFSAPAYFRIGEGGWVDPGSGKEPKPPDSSLTNIEAPGYPSGSQYYFQKTLAPADLVYTPSARTEIRCYVDLGEANDDGGGNAPEFFELGIFDASDVMLVYSTFPIEIKTLSKSLEHMVFIDF